MKCYASDYCQKDKSSCSDVCGGYRVLRALYNLSRIPERYRYTIALKPENGEDLEAFTTLDNYKNDVLSMVDEGRGLYIWGKSTGNGKTSWACKIMSYFFRKIAFNTGLENEGLYIFLPTFLEDLRDNYDNKDPEFDEILRMIKTCRLLIIDDIGSERVTDWVRERMVSIINTRVSNNLIKHGADMIVIDQLSLMSDKRRADIPRIAYNNISEDLFLMSKELKKPVLLMAQANREAVKNRKKGESPELHDLAESDGVGQNATRVLSLSVIDGTLKISVKKNRYGINNKEVLMIWEVNTGYLKPLLSENPEESTEDKKDDKPDGEKDKGGEKDYGF